MPLNKEFIIECFMLIYLVIKCIWKSLVSWILSYPKKDISGDIVLVTGGSTGIGRQISLYFAKYRPKQIIIWGREEESLKKVSEEICKQGVASSYMVCDVANRDQVYKIAREIRSKIGNVTILVNNAGVVYGNDIIDSKETEMQRTMDVNTLAHFWTTKAFLPHMMEHNHGHIVCISSLIGLIAIPGIADYAASKFAVTGFMETLSYELAASNKTGVHTTTIHPYLVDTELFAGCTLRFPSLFPPLKQDYVARRTVDAVLMNRRMIVMPRIMYIIIMLKTILPTECILLVQKFTGVDKTMTHFHGRKKLKPA